MWKSLLAIWGSTAIAIGIAIYYTHDMRCLWFLLIPMTMRTQHVDHTEVKKEKTDEEGDHE